MSTARRDFLKTSALGLASAALVPATRADAQPQAPPTPPSPPAPPGMPPAFGTGPSVGPEVTPTTLAEAEKLMQIELTPVERAQAAGNWRVSMAPLYERRTGPRKGALDPTLAPASRW
ncbi:MAG TPA: twin-arginine translocation signal domain-containing protein, partial [Vicinamibacteria bacterium]|nr:twin-arginine translocation signal domain-containing protein [Vicinamibacteria bacterium]